MTTEVKRTRKKPARRTVLCEVCGRGFQAAHPKAKTCSQSCRSISSDMGQRARLLGGLGIEFKLGLSDAGLPTFNYRMPVDSWPKIEAAATVKGISADAYLDGWVRFARTRMIRRVAADQEEAQSHA